jgi:hypothetical protein
MHLYSGNICHTEARDVNFDTFVTEVLSPAARVDTFRI